MNNLAVLLLDTKRYFEAAELAQVALLTQKDALGFERNALLIEHTLAEALFAMRKVDDAAPHYAWVVSRATELLPAAHPSLAVYRSNYAKCLISLKRFDGVEKLLYDALLVLYEVYDEEHPQTREVLRQLTQFYNATGNAAALKTLRTDIARRLAERRAGEN